MNETPRFRTFVEREEYSAQFDAIQAKHSADFIERVLAPLFWGIATNPTAYDQVLGRIRMAQSRSLGLMIPTFKIFFAIEKEGEHDEHILLCWIEESNTVEDISGYLM